MMLLHEDTYLWASSDGRRSLSIAASAELHRPPEGRVVWSAPPEKDACWAPELHFLRGRFLIFFACEIVLRTVSEGCAYFRASALNSLDAGTVVASLAFSPFAMFANGPDMPILRLFRLTRIVKMVGAYNRLVKMRERFLRTHAHAEAPTARPGAAL